MSEPLSALEQHNDPERTSGLGSTRARSLHSVAASGLDASRPSSVTSLKRILLVDDEAHVLRVMKLSLDRNGYDVDTALNGEIALGMMQEVHYDAVITDIDMPRMNGRELCEAIQQHFEDCPPMVVVVVDDVTEDSVDWIAQFPNAEFLEKPVSLRWLVARLSEYFGHYQRAS